MEHQLSRWWRAGELPGLLTFAARGCSCSLISCWDQLFPHFHEGGLQAWMRPPCCTPTQATFTLFNIIFLFTIILLRPDYQASLHMDCKFLFERRDVASVRPPTTGTGFIQLAIYLLVCFQNNVLLPAKLLCYIILESSVPLWGGFILAPAES